MPRTKPLPESGSLLEREYERRPDGRLKDGRKRRRSQAPQGICSDCWAERLDTAGEDYAIRHPDSRDDAEPRRRCQCDQHVAVLRSIGMRIVPWKDRAQMSTPSGSHAAEVLAFVLVAREPLFEVGAKPGDEILIRPGDKDPVVLVRKLSLPDYTGLAASVQAGRARVSAGLEPVDVIAGLVQLAAAHPRRPERFPPRPVLSFCRAVK